MAGATGVIGRRLVPQLVERGHEVTGMTRSPERAPALERSGAAAVVCDALDPPAVRAALESASPEVVVHELTDLPPALDPRKLREAYAANDRLRREGTRALVDAALAAGSRRMVAQSIAFLYAPEGEPVKDEDARPFTDAPAPFGGAVLAALDLERMVTGSPPLEGVVLRYGFFYGPGTYYAADGSVAAEVRRRRYPLIGRAGGVFSFIHVDDAAAATVAAVEGGRPGIYNIVDDRPVSMAEWLPRYAEALGAKPPLRVPKLLARLVAGAFVVSLATELRGASNQRAKAELGWRPRYPSFEDGFGQALG